jgi:hypothetical protein
VLYCFIEKQVGGLLRCVVEFYTDGEDRCGCCRWMQNRVRVCRGVLQVWGSRIQDSRTDFWGFWWKMVDSASMRGWCKMKDLDGTIGDTNIIEMYIEGKTKTIELLYVLDMCYYL